jgi:hypothetical protein
LGAFVIAEEERALLRLLPPGESLLEVGAGTGYWLRRLPYPRKEHSLYIQTIHVPIGFFLAPCKHPSHLRVFTADTGGSAGTFPLVETFGFEAQRQDGLG